MSHLLPARRRPVRRALAWSAIAVIATGAFTACSPQSTPEEAAGSSTTSTGATASPTGPLPSPAGSPSPASAPQASGESGGPSAASTTSDAPTGPESSSGQRTISFWAERPQGQEVGGPAAEQDFAAGLKAYNALKEMTLGKGVTELPQGAARVASEDLIEEMNEGLPLRDGAYLEGGKDAMILETLYRAEDFVQFDVCTREGMTYHHPANTGPVEEPPVVETVSAQRIEGRWKVTDVTDYPLGITCARPGQKAWEEPGLKKNPDTATEYERVARTFDALIDSNMAPGASTLSPEDAALVTEKIAAAFNEGAADKATEKERLRGKGSAQLLRGVLLRDYELDSRQDHAAIDVCWTGDYHLEMPDGSRGKDPDNPLTQGKGLVAHIFAVRDQGESWRIASWHGTEENVC